MAYKTCGYLVTFACHILLAILPMVTSEPVYIKPVDNSLCPDETSQCMTLTKYATSRHNTPSSNTTLLLLPGNHSLNANLTIVNIAELAIITDERNVSVRVTCTQMVKFQFQNVSKLHMRGLQLIGCTDNYFTMVDDFLFENCEIHGQKKNGTGLRLNHVGWALIRDSLFVSLRGTRLVTPTGRTYVNGGAMALNYTNVLIEGCMFDNNAAHDGGALYAPFSNVTITSKSSFTNNKADHNGGGIYIWNGTLTINNSSGRNNAALGNGGLVYVTVQSLITMEECDLSQNTAGTGGAVRLQNNTIGSFVNCTFTNNGALYNTSGNTYGGALCMTFSNGTVVDTMFLNNNSSHFGGGIYIYVGELTLHNSVLCRNEADRGGGMYASLISAVIRNVSFCENVASYDGGGLWIENSLTTINASQFTNNTASIASAIRSTRGTTHNEMNLTDMSFTHNIANFSTLYISQNTITISGNTTYSHNNGSLFVYSSIMFVTGYAKFTHNSYLTKDSSIEEGGAVTTYQSNVTFNGYTEFTNNVAEYGGAIFATESELHKFGHLIIANNTAMNSGGGIYSYQTGLNFKTSSAVIQNNDAKVLGGGIYASSTIVRLFGGSLKFYQNTAKMGGGISLILSGKLYIIKERPECNATFCNQNQSEWIRLDFIENSASYGGGVYVSDTSNCASIPFRVRSTAGEECFFQGLSLYTFHDKSSMNYRNTRFLDNKASIDGHTIYGGLLDRCSVSPFAEVFENYYAVEQISANSFTYLKNVTNIKDDNIYREISSKPVRVCFCKNGQPDCGYQPPKMYVKKGQTFRVPAVIVNQVNTSMVGTIQSILLSGDGGVSEGEYSQQILHPGACTNLNYSLLSPNLGEVIGLYAEGPCKDIGISNRTIEVEFLPCEYCPIGFKVPPSSCDCGCDPRLYPDYITNCSVETQTVRRRGDTWITYINESDLEGYITYTNCPYDYCLPATSEVHIDLNKVDGSDAQCAYSRSNLLCGSCKGGLSVTLGTSNCKQCSNYWLALLLVFAVAGVALVVFLLVCNLTVAIGTINGLIFYANVIAANRATFLPFHTPNIFTVFIAWINLDFGFETCFYDGLNGYAKTWLQLAFPTYIIFLVGMVIILSEKFQKFGALLHNRDSAATLATLVLLSYSKLHRTIIAVFSFADVYYPDGSSRLVWLIDANIRYLETKHIPLFLTTLVILLLGLVYTLFLTSWQWLKRCSDRKGMKWLNNVKLYSFVNPYFAPFSKKHRYWTGLLLLVRALLYNVTAVNIHGDPSINLLTIIVLACFVLLLKERFKVKIYTKWPIDTLESSYIFNLIIFSAATLYVRNTLGNQKALAYTSTTIAFATFLGILLYHTYTYVFPAIWREKLKWLLTALKYSVLKKTADPEESGLLEEQRVMPRRSHYTELREPLINDETQNTDHSPRPSSAVQQRTVQTTYSEISAIPTVDELMKLKQDSY